MVFDGICDYLDGTDGADPTPFATSTMWVIEVSQKHPKKIASEVFPLELEGLSEEGGETGSALSYSVVSEDLVSEDINSGTLYPTYDSSCDIFDSYSRHTRHRLPVHGVRWQPLLFTAALSWTYGLVALFGYEFTVIDIAVAPVILGLGLIMGFIFREATNSMFQRV